MGCGASAEARQPTLQSIPTNFADVVHVGDAVIPEVAFSGQGAGKLTSWVSNTPANNYAWQAWGKLQVYKGGEYRFCSLSSDGSRVYIDTELLVNNDGVSCPPFSARALALLPWSQRRVAMIYHVSA
jgi:hypothetical protein